MRKRTRSERTRLLYVLLCVGTGLVGLLAVGISSLLLRSEERSLYGKESYVSFQAQGSTGVGSPLSLAMRASLLEQVDQAGPRRLSLPEELTEAEAKAEALAAWNALMSELPDGSTLPGRTPQTAAVLRDFPLGDGARYALWCAQAYAQVGADVYTLTVYLDSRTGEPLMLTGALDVPDTPLLGFAYMANTLGLGYDQGAVQAADNVTSLPLEGGFALRKESLENEFIIRLEAPVDSTKQP